MSRLDSSDHRPSQGSVLDRQVVRFLSFQEGSSALAASALVVVTLGASWVLTYVLGGAGKVPPHWFYIPIVVAGARFGPVGAGLTAVVAGVLAGPLMPADVSTGTQQLLSDWGIRAVAFLVIGLVITSMVRLLTASLGRELELTRRELEFATRKAAVIATVSHEFRTPLTIIDGVSRTLAGAAAGEEQRSLLDGLRAAVKRLDALVDTVLTTAEGLEGLREPSHVPVDVARLCRLVVDELGELEASTRLRLHVEPEVSAFSTDPEILRRVLRHVIENALKFSPSEEPVTVRAHREGGEVVFLISDHGPGVPTSLMERADAFVQADQSSTRTRSGLGIGLFAVHTLTRHLGGRFELRARSEGGTVAVLRFPVGARGAKRLAAVP